MRKFSLRKSQMTGGTAAIVEQSREWAKALVHAEARGPGDYGNALARVARSLGVGRAKLWALLYRPPKDVPASVFVSLFAAYQATCNSQKRKFENELARTRAIAGADSILVRAAFAVAGETSDDDQ